MQNLTPFNHSFMSPVQQSIINYTTQLHTAIQPNGATKDKWNLGKCEFTKTLTTNFKAT